MNKLVAALLAAVAVLAGACQQAAPRSHFSSNNGVDLHCRPGDGGEYDPVLGWGFCFPATWHTLNGERTQKTPIGVDAVFDITDYASGPTNGFFGVIIISTDQRGSAANLGDWISTNVGPAIKTEPLQWGNAIEAAAQVGSDRPTYYALTPHHVIVLELHSGPGNLDLQSAMSARFQTWKFTY